MRWQAEPPLSEAVTARSLSSDLAQLRPAKSGRRCQTLRSPAVPMWRATLTRKCPVVPNRHGAL